MVNMVIDIVNVNRGSLRIQEEESKSYLKTNEPSSPNCLFISNSNNMDSDEIKFTPIFSE